MAPEKNPAAAAGQATERSGPVTNRVPRDDLSKTVITVFENTWGEKHCENVQAFANEINGHFCACPDFYRSKVGFGIRIRHFLQSGGHWFESLIAHFTVKHFAALSRICQPSAAKPKQ